MSSVSGSTPIKPLLEEHFYGTGRDIEAEFGPKALERRMAEAADATPPEDELEADAADGLRPGRRPRLG